MSTNKTIVSRIVAKLRQPDVQAKPFLTLIADGCVYPALTYTQFVHEAIFWSQAMRQAGVLPRSRVAVIVRHSLPLYSSFLGAVFTGAVPAMIPPPCFF